MIFRADWVVVGDSMGVEKRRKLPMRRTIVLRWCAVRAILRVGKHTTAVCDSSRGGVDRSIAEFGEGGHVVSTSRARAWM